MKNTLIRHVYSLETILELISIWCEASKILGKKTHYVREVESLLKLNDENMQEQFSSRYDEVSQCFCSVIRKWRTARSYLYDCKDCDISYVKHQGFLLKTREMKAKIKEGDLSQMNARRFLLLKRDMDIYNSHVSQTEDIEALEW